ncbi:unnamed protein product [Orchesella dallaii]|uniref:Uncharacterized protein n=1 Tax=Orchesella dallaii TaxID=48710 RepID=A0ABP1PTR9_9HEXA
MAKFLVLIVFVASVNLDVCDAGAIAFPHRETGLDDLKSIDSYVSSALPVLQDGFFIGTPRGPILVKSGPSPGDRNARPAVRSKYYNTLPRLIPAGFEGVAISHFNLGAASPIQPYSLSKHLQNIPAAQPQQYVATHNVQSPQHYVAQPQQLYLTQQPATQYVTEQQQFVPQPEQQSQQYVPQPEQQAQQYYPQPEQQPQQYVAHPQQQPQQFLSQEQQNQILQSEQSQQDIVRFGQPQRYAGPPSQFNPEQSDGRQIPQESAQISERIQSPNPAAQPSFQNDNLLRAEPEQSVTAYQTQIFGAERFQSHKLVPNSAVIETTEFEQTLPETLRNQFYKNANLATLLAQESLPVQGEQIIDEWDTNKIAKGKIRALLHGAGLI